MTAILVTGAGARLGRALALRFAGEGHDVALHYNGSEAGARETAAGVEALGRRAVLLQADLAEPDACADLAGRAADALPSLVGLINSASLFERDRLETMDPAFLRRHMAVNAEAPLHLGRAFAGRVDGRGWIVNLLDAKVFQTTPEFFSYTLSKLTLVQVTEMMAMALAPRIRVNGIAPGLVLRSGAQTDEVFERVHDRNPLERGPRAEDICDMAVTLAGAGAVSGQIVAVDGGRHFYSPSHALNT